MLAWEIYCATIKRLGERVLPLKSLSIDMTIEKCQFSGSLGVDFCSYYILSPFFVVLLCHIFLFTKTMVPIETILYLLVLMQVDN